MGCAANAQPFFQRQRTDLKNMFGLKAHAKASLGWALLDLNGALQNFGISKF